jgi:fructokinase
MITVAGEALIDLIVDQAGQVDPRMGGGPFNVARAVARLGQPVTFLGRLSGDRFGQLMRADLERNGVRIALADPSDEPTTLALVDVDPAGVPAYHFYLAETSSRSCPPGPRPFTSVPSAWSWSRPGPASKAWPSMPRGMSW